MQTRPVIDMARGALMASFALNADDAWAVLVEASQHSNTKLHQLAQDLVDALGTGPLPDPMKRLRRSSVPFCRAARTRA